MGNGAAMRVAPAGAFFADNFDRAATEAHASAEVTHAHPKGQAGAVAVAVAAAWFWRERENAEAESSHLFEVVLDYTAAGPTRNGIEKARELPLTSSIETAVRKLGNGSLVTSPDTVPFALWCAARHPRSYEDALWTTVAGLGDRDTTCAIVGGIVVLGTGRDAMPAKWLAAREPLQFHI